LKKSQIVKVSHFTDSSTGIVQYWNEA